MIKVIVIEDDQFLLENIEFILEAENYKVFTASSGKKGISLIEEIVPDVIISDIMLPDIEGYEILKSVRNNSGLRDIPFIFLTARAEHKDLRLGMNLGADDYLTKPFNAGELIEAIKVRIELTKLRKESPVNRITDDSKLNQAPSSRANELNLKATDTVFVNDVKGIVKLRLDDIIFIQAYREYSEIYAARNKKYVVRKLIKQWEETLPTESFIRIHRSIIINLAHVARIEKWFNYSFRIYLNDLPEPIISSRRYTSKIKELYFI